MSSPVIEEGKADRRATDGAPDSASERVTADRTSGPVARLLSTSQGRCALLVGLVAFGVYLCTLAVSIVWGDSPELTAAAYNLGIPHPTGYPLYMLLSHAFLKL